MGVILVLRRRQVLGFLVFVVLIAGAVVFLAQHWSAVGRDGLSGASLVAAVAGLPGQSSTAAHGAGAAGAGAGGASSGTPSSATKPSVKAGSATGPSAGGSAAAGASTAAPTAAAGTAGAYFAAAHLRRAQAESRERAQLQQIADDTKASATVRAEAQQQLLQLEQLQQEQTTAELVLEAKGYPESLVMLTPGGATVVVGASTFTAADAARVGQAVAQVAGLDPDQVQIVPRAPAQG